MAALFRAPNEATATTKMPSNTNSAKTADTAEVNGAIARVRANEVMNRATASFIMWSLKA